MKITRRIGIVLFSFIAFLTACNSPTSVPTSTPAMSPTGLPTETPTPESTATLTLTLTLVPPTETAAGRLLPLPSGTPASNWQGIPVMPVALAGEGDNSCYTFTVKGQVGDVQKYYEAEMPKLSWKLFASGQGTTNAILLMFMKGTELITVSIIPQEGDLIFVMFTK